jgi:modification methylase
MNRRFIHRLVWEPFGPALTSVWPTGDDSLDVQLAGRGYHHTTGTDPALIAPAIAEYAVTMFTRRGDVVLDPDCGAGTTVVEALRAGRHAIGLTTHPRWWRLARANVTATKAGGAPTDGMVLLRRPSTVTAAQTAGLTGRVALLLTTLRPATSTTGLAGLRTLLQECRPLLRPGGHVVITCAPQRHPIRHDLLDLPSQILVLGAAAGLAPIARCLALTSKVRGRRVFTRATLAQRRTATRIERAIGHPVALPAHHTALVFRVDPDAVDLALTHPIPPLFPPPRRHRTHPAEPNENPPRSVRPGVPVAARCAA